MKKLKNIAYLAATMTLLGACGVAVDFEGLSAMTPRGTPFTKSLYSEYLELARLENAEGDYEEARYFAEKSELAGGGEQISPQPMPHRNLPSANADNLANARHQLTEAIAAGWAKKDPSHTARAQAMFDCWMEEQEENFQPTDISRCRAAFDQAIRNLAEATPIKAQAAVAQLAPYIVFFDFDSAVLTHAASATIDTATAAAEKRHPSKILITGHTDSAGASAYNIALSQRRVDSVLKAFVKNGISRSILSNSRHGEERPRVARPDGTREDQNRRVEITFQ
jgi:OmpA-OmpF porin, OOP family